MVAYRHVLIQVGQIILLSLCCILTPIDIFVIQSCSLIERLSFPIVGLHCLHVICSRFDNSTSKLDWMILAVDISSCIVFATNHTYCSNTLIFMIRYIAIVRMWKLTNLHSYFNVLYQRTSTNALKNLLRCSYCFIMFTVAIILLSSLWFWIACYDNLEQCLNRDNWVSNDSILQVNSTFSIVIRSMYFIIQTLYTIGFGDIHPITCEEMIFACIIMLIAVTFNGLLISVVSALFHNLNLPYILYQKQIHLIKEILKANKLPDSTVKQLFNFKKLLYQKQLGCDEETLLEQLPQALKMQLKGYILQKHMNEHFLLNSFVDVNKEDCIKHTSLCSFPKGFHLYRQGNQPTNIITIRSGTITGVATTCSSDSAANFVSEVKFGAGETIADYEVIYHKNTQLTYQTQTFCEVSLLPETFVENLLANCKFIDQVQSELQVIQSDGSEEVEKIKNTLFNKMYQKVTKICQFIPISVIRKQQKLLARVNISNSVLPLPIGGNSLLSIPRTSPFNTKSQVSLLSNFNKSIVSFGKLSKRSSYFSLPSKSKLYQSSLSTLNTYKKSNSSKSTHDAGYSNVENFMRYLQVNFIWNYAKSPIRQVLWRCLILFIYIYNSLVTMIRIATYLKFNGMGSKSFDYTLIVDYIFDILLLLNTICKANNSTLSSRSQLFHSNYVISFILLVPLDIFAFFTPICFLRINKLLSTCFISSALKNLRSKLSKLTSNSQAEKFQFSSISSLLISVISYFRNASEGGLEVIEQSIWTLIFLVWLSVCWNTMHHYDFTNDTAQLISSLYWCLTTLTTTGYGDIISETTMETFLCLVNMCIGPIIFASAIAYSITFAQGSDAYLHWFNHKQSVSRNFLVSHSGFIDNDTVSIKTRTKQPQNLDKDNIFGRREDWLYDVGISHTFKVILIF